MYAATSASRAAASIRRAPSRTISSINDPPADGGTGPVTGVGSSGFTTVSTGVPSRPALARGPCWKPSSAIPGKVRPPKVIHRFQALLLLRGRDPHPGRVGVGVPHRFHRQPGPGTGRGDGFHHYLVVGQRPAALVDRDE